MKEYCYFVIDMKSFFASVECAERGLDPYTTNLVVADEDRTDKTICLAVSPSLRKMGVKNRCRLFEVPKNIDFIIAPPRMQKYIEYATKIYSIYLKYISKNDIHVYSIDECFIDVTDYIKLYNLTPLTFAKKLMDEIYDTLKIPSSVGIGSNLYLAKIALDITAKTSPQRIGFLDERGFIETLWHHTPITDFWGISDGIASRLEKYGIKDMSDIACFNENILYKEFGINAELIIDHAWGKESCTMKDIKEYKSKSNSISSSQILPEGYTFSDAKLILKEMIQEGCYRLSKRNLLTGLIHIFVSYEDKKIPVSKATKKLSQKTNLYSKISKPAIHIFDEIVDKKNLIRKIGYDFCDLEIESSGQNNFFENVISEKKEKNITKTMLNIKNKFGKNSILKAMDYSKKATQKERNEQIGGHKSGKNENAKNQ